MPNLSGPTALVLLVVILLLFGAPKLPGLAKSLGQSMKIFKREMESGRDDSAAPHAPAVHPEAPAPDAPLTANPTPTPASDSAAPRDPGATPPQAP